MSYSPSISKKTTHKVEAINIFDRYKFVAHFYGKLWDARWQQTYQVNFHCLRSSEHVDNTENNGFYLVSLLPPSVPKASH